MASIGDEVDCHHLTVACHVDGEGGDACIRRNGHAQGGHDILCHHGAIALYRHGSTHRLGGIAPAVMVAHEGVGACGQTFYLQRNLSVVCTLSNAVVVGVEAQAIIEKTTVLGLVVGILDVALAPSCANHIVGLYAFRSREGEFQSVALEGVALLALFGLPPFIARLQRLIGIVTVGDADIDLHLGFLLCRCGEREASHENGND